MDIYYSIDYWMFLPQVWLILGILLVGVELLDGNMISLPIGVASFLMAVVIYGQNNMWLGDTAFVESWRGVLFLFSVLALVSVGILKYLFQFRLRKKNTDINEY